MTSGNEPQLVLLTHYADERGSVFHFSDFELNSVKRVYFIAPLMEAGFRGWHGHRFESKTFRCIRGSFEISSVKVLDWEKPSGDRPQSWELNESNGSLLSVPAGHANGIRPLEPNSLLMVMSNKTLGESLADDYRFQVGAFKNF